MDKIDLSGKRFGRLNVVGEGTPFQRGRNVTRAWICKCDCGKVVKVRQENLAKGRTRSCGCLRKDRAKPLTAFGSTRTVSRWAELTGIPRSVIHNRLRLGWPPEKAVTVPVRKKEKKDDAE